MSVAEVVSIVNRLVTGSCADRGVNRVCTGSTSSCGGQCVNGVSKDR